MQVADADSASFVSLGMERVKFEPPPAGAVYGFCPGLTVEATKLEDVAVPFRVP